MKESECPSAELLAENEHLKARAEELDEVLRAIRAGEVDAIVGTPDMGGQIFTLESAETPYRHFVENMDQGAIILDSDLTLLYCNRKFAEMAGRDIRSLIGTPACEFLTTADVDACNMVLALPSGERLSKEIVFRHPDGNQIPVHLDVGLLEETASGRSYSAILTDLSLVKKNETIIQAENFTRSIFENIGDAVFVCDADYTVIRANYEAYRVCGCNPINKPFLEVMPLIHEGEEKNLPWELPSPDDTRIGVWSEVTLPAKEGGNMNLLVHSSRLKDAAGTIIGWAIDVRDISETRHYEETLRVANKKLNLLSSITRHDIINQVMGAEMILEIMKMEGDIPPDSKTAEDLQTVDAALKTIERQIIFTRDYQDLGVKAPKWQKVGVLIEKTAKIAGNGLSMINEVGTLEIYADLLFEKVIYNLFDNAVRYGGKITSIRFFSEESPDGLKLICEDDGVGVPAEVKEKIFNRQYYQHTGLGLFLSREILSITGMTITETGVPGEGARFEIQVPPGAWRLVDEKL